MYSTLKRWSYPVRRAIGEALCPSLSRYTASGEDFLAWSWLSSRVDPTQIRYLDIGASHPSRLNNTFLFYRLGGSGVLIEPDPDQARLLRRRRPRDVVIEAGAAFDDARTMTLVRMSNPMFNSFSRERADFVCEYSKSWRAEDRLRIVGTTEVQLVPVNDIMSEHFAGGIHFLSIDAEGRDLAILRTLDIERFSPDVICVEEQASIEEHLKILGPNYRVIFQSPDNFMFCRI